MSTCANLIDVLKCLASVVSLELSLGSQQQNLSIAHHLKVDVLQSLESGEIHYAVFLKRLVLPEEVTLVAIDIRTRLYGNTESRKLVVSHHCLVKTIAVGTLASYECLVERLTWIHKSVGSCSNYVCGLSAVVQNAGTPSLHQEHHVELIPLLLRVVTLLEFEHRLAVIVVLGVELHVVSIGSKECIFTRINHIVEHRCCLAVLTLEQVSLTQECLSHFLCYADAGLLIVNAAF